MWKEIDSLLNEMIEGQKKDLLKTGRRFVPQLTPDDILQPNDFGDLEQNPYFRYEEGILAGIQSVQAALRALQKEDL